MAVMLIMTLWGVERVTPGSLSAAHWTLKEMQKMVTPLSGQAIEVGISPAFSGQLGALFRDIGAQYSLSKILSAVFISRV